MLHTLIVIEAPKKHNCRLSLTGSVPDQLWTVQYNQYNMISQYCFILLASVKPVFSFQVSWLVGWLWVWRPFETVFQSTWGRLPKRGRKRRERIDDSKNVQTIPTRTDCKRSRLLPNYNPNCRTPRHWKFTQHHRTTRPPLPFKWDRNYHRSQENRAGYEWAL